MFERSRISNNMKKKFGIKILEISGILATGIVMHYSYKNKIKKEQNLVQKNDRIIQLFELWIQLKQNGINIDEFLFENGYHTIAIYGMGHIGQRLYDELKNSKVTVKYIIDQNADSIKADIDVYPVRAGLPETDAIIVTAITYFDEIQEKLVDNTSCCIWSLEDIMYEMNNRDCL